jgi:8-oxo-dGTP diphosphatase
VAPAAEPPAALALRATRSHRAKPEQVQLAFDHALIIDAALYRLRERLEDPLRPSRFELVPPRFTLAELQRVYEVILGRSLDKRNFRARILARGLVEPVAAARKTGPHRPAQLFRWKR